MKDMLSDRLRDVSLCWLTIAGAGHLELVECAASAGFGSVGMKLVPRAGDPVKPLVGDVAEIRRVRAGLSTNGIGVLEMGGVWLAPDFSAQATLPSIELGAELGAKYLIAVAIDPDRSRMADNLASIGSLAWAHGIRTVVEFTAYTDIPTLAAARTMVAEVGQPRVGILLDALHFARSGGLVEDLADHDNADVGIFHLCDGPKVPPADIKAEGRAGRLYPGEGDLPLAAYLATMPPSVMLEVEAPCAQYRALPFREQARIAAEATRKFLDGTAERI